MLPHAYTPRLDEVPIVARMVFPGPKTARISLSRRLAPNDADLVMRTLSGDKTAFTLLMSRHRGWTLRFIHRHVRNSEDARDLLQDTFLAAWRALALYQHDRSFDAWLRRIALNKCRDQARRMAARHGISGCFADDGGSDEATEVADPSPGPVAQIEGEQALRQLEQNLRRLSQALTQPLLLTVIEGLSHFEVGKLLGMSSKAVETRIYRARARLEQLCGENRLHIAC